MAGIRYKGQIFSGVASVGRADDVAYDNTQSGLTAGNVQDAVDEVNTNLQQMRVKRATVYSGQMTVATSSANVDFSLPSDFHMSLGAILQRSWPEQTWDPSACVSIRQDLTMESTPVGRVRLSSTSTQTYTIVITLLYI